MENKLAMLKELKRLLIDRNGDNIVNIILFGSQANGNPNEFSDFDILIVLKNDYDWRLKEAIRDVCFDLAIDYEILFDISFISLSEIKDSLRAKLPVFSNAIEKGLYV